MPIWRASPNPANNVRNAWHIRNNNLFKGQPRGLNMVGFPWASLGDLTAKVFPVVTHIAI